MKISNYTLLLINILLLNSLLSAQFLEADYIAEFNNSTCGTTENLYSSFPYFPVDNDTLRILVVFAKFPNDNWNSTEPGSQATQYWDGNLWTKPYWANDIIKPNTSNIGNSNITAYYRDASFGKFMVIGDVYPDLYIFQHPSTYYHPDSNKHIGYATKELLLSIDRNVDFSLYDKFDPEDIDDDGNLREPDNRVDFVLIVFRFFKGTDPYTGSGFAALGGSNKKFDNINDEITTDENMIISADFPGSGAIATQLTPWGYNISVHELGHYLFNWHRDHMGLFNLMNKNGNSFISADEREAMGWGPSAIVPTSNSTHTLQDYGTTGQFIKLTKGRYTYYLENRRRINYHLSNQWCLWNYFSYQPFTAQSPDSMLLIHRYYNSVVSANGRWNWKMSEQYPTKYIVDTFNNGRAANIFFTDKPNKYDGTTIFNLREMNAVSWQTGLPFAKTKTAFHIGGDSNSCFDVGYNQVYSPWSNPGIEIEGNDSFAVEITGKDNDGNLIVNVYLTNIIQGAPSKPQYLKISKQFIDDSKFRPRLDWYKNREPDIQKYLIYRGYIATPGVEPTYYYLGETTDSTYLDQSLYLYRGQGGSGICQYEFQKYAYRVVAVDNTDKNSVKSERDSISGYSDPCAPEESSTPKEMETKNREIKLKFSLSQNYPNPFNPVTSIKYTLPNDAIVNIKIYNILGQEVKVLENSFKLAGEYIMQFNGSELTSGIYFYRFTAGNFTEVKKMLILK